MSLILVVVLSILVLNPYLNFNDTIFGILAITNVIFIAILIFSGLIVLINRIDVSSIDEKRALTWKNIAEKHAEKGEIGKAIEACKKAMEIDPNSTDVWGTLGYIYAQKGNVDRTIVEDAILEIALRQENDPKMVNPQIQTIDDKIESESVENFENTQSSAEIIEKFEHMGVSIAEDLTLEEEVIDKRPKEPLDWNNIALDYLNKKEFEKAIEAGKQALDIDPNFGPVWNTFGYIYDKMGDYKKAINAYQKVLDSNQNSNSQAVLMRLSLSYLNNGELNKTIIMCERVLKKEPNDIEALNILSLVYAKKRNYERVIKTSKTILESDTNYINAWLSLGYAYSEQGEYNKAIKAYLNILKINPKIVVVWNNLGYIYNQKGEYDNAITASKRAIEISPKFALAWKTLGYTYNQIGDYNQATVAYSHFVELEPNNYIAWYNYAQSLLKGGYYTKALDAINHNLELRPDFVDGKKLRKEILKMTL